MPPAASRQSVARGLRGRQRRAGRAVDNGTGVTLVAAVRLRAGSGGSVAVILDPLGGAVADLGPAATAFRWRDALATVQWYIGLPEHPTGSQVRQAYHWINHSGHPALHGASVGAYVNYLEPGRSVGSYYGRNLARLRKVKARYDPSGFFRSRYTV
jgi:hypothetical protein